MILISSHEAPTSVWDNSHSASWLTIGPAGSIAVHEVAAAWNIIAYVIYAVVLRVPIDEFFAPIVLDRAAYIRGRR